MIRLSELIGQEAVSLRTAEKTGTVKGIALTGNRITRVRVGDRLVESSAVRSFEGDVLTYDEPAGDAAEQEQHGRHDHPADGARDPRGALVLDARGDGLGTIADLAISADGVVDSILLDNGEAVTGSRLRVLGSFAAVLGSELPPPTGLPVGS